MKILYDHQIFSYQKLGGASRYFYELMNEFSNIEEIDFHLAIFYSDNEYLKNAAFMKCRDLMKNIQFNERIRLFKIFFIYLINKWISKKLICKENYDIFHPTFYDPYFYPLTKPFVLTILDMIPENFPDMFSSRCLYSRFITNKWIKAKKILAQKASKIIAISEHTKKDIIKFYGIDEKKIDVIHLGNSLKQSNTVISHTIKLPDKYVLFVGARSRYKNFDNFIKAMEKILKNYKKLNIVCTGGGKFTSEEIKLFIKLGINDRIHQYSVNDDILGIIYKHAIALVFPSLYEGFGLPVIEAFSCGCPVVLNNSSCFPEIAGDGAIYFDGNDIESIQNIIEKVLYDEALREELICKGRERAKVFTWENTGRKTLSLYKNTVKQGRV